MMNDPDLCSVLEWDSAFFGVTIGRLNTSHLNAELIPQIDACCLEKKIRCLYFLADNDHEETLHLAEVNGFHLTDIRVTLEHSLNGWETRGEPPPGIHPALAEDLPALLAIAASSFRDTRFYYDGHFSRERCDHLYETWIENSLSGFAQAVFVIGETGYPQAFITCHLDAHAAKGRIGLLGVSSDARGKGVGQAMVNGAVDWFGEQKAASVEVVTQGRNISAQRLYQKCGFLTKEVKLWYHRWLDE